MPWSLGWASQSATAWCGLRGCHVGCLPPLRLISRVRRDCEEEPITSGLFFFCCLITFFLPLLVFLLASRAATRICTLCPHHHLFIYPFLGVVFHSALWFSPDLRGKKGPRRHRRRGHAHADGSFRSKQTVLTVVASHLWPLNLPLLSSPPTCVFVDHQSVNCGSFVDQPNLPTGTWCKCRSSCLAHAIGVKGPHDKGEVSSGGCEDVVEDGGRVVASVCGNPVLKWHRLPLMSVTW